MTELVHVHDIMNTVKAYICAHTCTGYQHVNIISNYYKCEGTKVLNEAMFVTVHCNIISNRVTNAIVMNNIPEITHYNHYLLETSCY